MKFFRKSLLIAAVFLQTVVLCAQNIFTDADHRLTINQKIMLLNPEREISFQEARLSDKFVDASAGFPNLGLFGNSIWVKGEIRNNSATEDLLFQVAYPILDEVQIFFVDSSGKVDSLQFGERYPFKQRKYQNPNYIVDLHLPTNATLHFYIRVKSSEQIILPIYIGKPETMWTNFTKENAITGIYIGIVLIMFFYNLFIFFSVRDRSYLYYVFYVIAAGFTQVGITGLPYQYLWPNLPAFETKSLVAFASISGIGGVLFTSNFLNAKVYARKLNYVLLGTVGLFLLALIMTLLNQEQTGFQIMQSATSLAALTILSTSFRAMFRGFDPAKFFVYAWTILLIGAIVFLLKDYGILPYTNLTKYSMQAASAFEMALLSFGLANRINILKAEKEASQAEALRAAEENEQIIREQNVVLEQKVTERTHELRESNQSLSVALADLKEAQSQLVDQEKMASLGQLTAGIAHEINNPINFVSSNVKPLKRDFELMIDLMTRIETIGSGAGDQDAKKQEIEALKKEFDFDYLLEEINFLLKGISEGSNRTAEIVKGLKLFSRVDEDDIKLANIHDGLDSTLIIINNSLNNKIEIVKDYGELPKVECFPGKLNQVFLNIISNGIYAVKQKFGNEAGGKVTLKTRQVDNQVEITLADNGTGMDEATKKKLFEPFFTTKPVGEGTGLGLSIVYNTINKHNGTIRVESEPGVGTSFIITIPLTQYKS